MNFNSELKNWKSILWQFLPNYNLSVKDNGLFSMTCVANGFTVTDKKGYNDSLYNVYDINSAYPYMLSTQQFPLDQEMEFIEDAHTFEDRLGIVEILFKGIPAPKYKDLDYFMFDGFVLELDKGKDIYCIHLTTLDAQIFLDMYEVKNPHIRNVWYFKNVGYLKGMQNNIPQFYERIRKIKEENKEEGKSYKQILNMVSYGMLIQIDTEKSTMYETLLRNDKVLLGMWVASYQRFRMFQLFKKYQKDILYMDTDSIMLKANRKFEEPVSKTELGKFKVEANNVNIAIIRPKSYIFIKDRKVVKQKIGGIDRDLTVIELKKLFTFGSVDIQEENYVWNEQTEWNDKVIQTLTVSLYYPYNFRSLSLD